MSSKKKDAKMLKRLEKVRKRIQRYEEPRISMEFQMSLSFSLQ
jgi:hypothetical protein